MLGGMMPPCLLVNIPEASIMGKGHWIRSILNGTLNIVMSKRTSNNVPSPVEL